MLTSFPGGSISPQSSGLCLQGAPNGHFLTEAILAPPQAEEETCVHADGTDGHRAPDNQPQAKSLEEALAVAAALGQGRALGQITLWILQASSLVLTLTAAAVGQGMSPPWSPPLCPAALG